jgi:hypothetical protein
VDEHVSTPLIEASQRTAFGEQVPMHVAVLAWQAWLTQGEASTQVPVASHVSGVWPLQFLAPTAQTPEQIPATHVLLLHGTAAPHVPLAEHVCTPLPEHWVVPGTQLPVHAPLTHA